MTREQINQLWLESTTVADFIIAIGAVKGGVSLSASTMI